MQQTGAVNFSEGLKARASGWFPAENDAGFTSSPANVGQDKDPDKRQRQAIEAFAKSAGFEIVGEFYDQAVSVDRAEDDLRADPELEQPITLCARRACAGLRTVWVNPCSTCVCRKPERVLLGLISERIGHTVVTTP